jgi:hypothetical protein
MKPFKLLSRDFKAIGVILSYWLVATIFVMGLTSIFTFIHFLIGHDIATLEYWLFSNTWEIIIFSQLGAAYVVWSFVSVRLNTNSFFKNLLSHLKLNIKGDILVVAFFIIINLIGFYHFDFAFNQFSYFKNMIICCGVLSFFLFDLFLLKQIRRISDSSQQGSFVSTIVFFLFKILFVFIVIPYKDNASSIYFFNIAMTYVIFHFYQTKLAPVITYTLCVIIPLSIIFPFDLIYGGAYSILTLTSPPSLVLTSSIWFVAMAYLFFKCRFSTIDDLLVAD